MDARLNVSSSSDLISSQTLRVLSCAFEVGIDWKHKKVKTF